MRDMFDINIGKINDDIKFFQEMEASKSRENYKKYATSKKASLKRKKKAGKRK